MRTSYGNTKQHLVIMVVDPTDCYTQATQLHSLGQALQSVCWKQSKPTANCAISASNCLLDLMSWCGAYLLDVREESNFQFISITAQHVAGGSFLLEHAGSDADLAVPIV